MSQWWVSVSSHSGPPQGAMVIVLDDDDPMRGAEALMRAMGVMVEADAYDDDTDEMMATMVPPGLEYPVEKTGRWYPLERILDLDPEMRVATTEEMLGE